MSPEERHSWSAEDDARLRDLYPRTLTRDLPALLSRTPSAIKNRAAAMHLKKNDDVNTHRRWLTADDEQLRQIYPDLPTTDVARRISRTVKSVYGRAKNLGIHKSDAYLASPAACRLRRGDNVGAAHRFKKGQVPPNKGLRRPGYSVGQGTGFIALPEVAPRLASGGR